MTQTHNIIAIVLSEIDQIKVRDLIISNEQFQENVAQLGYFNSFLANGTDEVAYWVSTNNLRCNVNSFEEC